jgi:hypothetical protein
MRGVQIDVAWPRVFIAEGAKKLEDRAGWFALLSYVVVNNRIYFTPDSEHATLPSNKRGLESG